MLRNMAVCRDFGRQQAHPHHRFTGLLDKAKGRTYSPAHGEAWLSRRATFRSYRFLSVARLKGIEPRGRSRGSPVSTKCRGLPAPVSFVHRINEHDLFLFQHPLVWSAIWTSGARRAHGFTHPRASARS
jgi:hypothetical protein